jgi:hypothetical protein
VAASPTIARIIARYELEHFAARYNDPDLYNRTAGVHAHPIFGTSAALAYDFVVWSFELPEDVKADGFVIKKGSFVCVILTK